MNSIIGQGMSIASSELVEIRQENWKCFLKNISSSQVSIPQEPIIRAIHRPRPGFARERNEEEFLCLALPDT